MLFTLSASPKVRNYIIVASRCSIGDWSVAGSQVRPSTTDILPAYLEGQSDFGNSVVWGIPGLIIPPATVVSLLVQQVIVGSCDGLIQKVMHDPKYLMPWKFWYSGLPRFEVWGLNVGPQAF